jgi:hypothetical protein
MSTTIKFQNQQILGIPNLHLSPWYNCINAQP